MYNPGEIIVVRNILHNHMCSWCPELEEEYSYKNEKETEQKKEYLEDVCNFVPLIQLNKRK